MKYLQSFNKKILLAALIGLLFSCSLKKSYPEVALTYEMDKDIVLINIGDGDRTEIASLLLDIEKCNPLVIGIDVIFEGHRQPKVDSVLAHAMENMSNDILAYRFESNGKEERSIESIRKFAMDEGYVNVDRKRGEASYFTPLKEVDGKLYQSFALQIVKKWKPAFNYNGIVNKSIPILFQRGLKQYQHFQKEDLKDKGLQEFLTNKIVLVGYLGPGDEDKHFTPMRYFTEDDDNKPDTYGLVIHANIIRTIIDAK
jgi:CHASE2 domain-containing sensor protein